MTCVQTRCLYENIHSNILRIEVNHDVIWPALGVSIYGHTDTPTVVSCSAPLGICTLISSFLCDDP